jgi:hypothetical protein
MFFLQSSLPTKEPISLRALAQPGGLLRKLPWTAPAVVEMRKLGESVGTAIFAGRNTYLPAEDSSEMARASVTNIESYLDYAPVGFPQ